MGVVVFATGVITVVLILMSSDFSWSPFRQQYQLQVLVDEAPGVAPDTPVRRRGILIGRVDSVTDTDNGALITLNIDGQKEIKSNEVARIQTSLIGDAVIDFSPVGPTANATIMQPGGPPLRGIYNPNPMDLLANLQGDLKVTIQSLGEAGQQVAELAEKVNKVLGEADTERINRVMASADTALANFSRVMADVEDITGDEQFKEELKRGLGTDCRRSCPTRVKSLPCLNALWPRRTRISQNLQGLTGPLGERGPELVDRLELSVTNLSAVFERRRSWPRASIAAKARSAG